MSSCLIFPMNSFHNNFGKIFWIKQCILILLGYKLLRIFVRVLPGDITTAYKPSSAQHFVAITTATLDAQYSLQVAWDSTAAADPIFTICRFGLYFKAMPVQ